MSDQKRVSGTELVKYQHLIEQIGDGIAVADLEGNIQFVNEAWAQMHGYTLEEIEGAHLSIFHTEEQVQNEVIPFNQVVLESGAHRGELGHARKDGTTFPSLMTTTLITDEDGEPLGFIGSIRDITEQRQAEASLRQSEERYRLAIDATQDGFWDWNVKTGDVYFSPRYYTMLGYEPNEFAPSFEAWENLVHPDDLPASQSAINAHFNGETPAFRTEFQAQTKDGGWRWILSRGAVVERDKEGNPVRMMGTHTDNTERKKLEQQLEESLERRARQVQTSTEVAQEIAAAPALDELYRRVVSLVKERFGYYHTQIFRHDLEVDAMVVVEGYGQAGEKMKEAGHSLPYGLGVVGTAAATGQPVLAADTTHDPNWVPHPNLPGTQGELAVPIKLRDKVLGVLDVQSDVAGALGEEDQVMLQGLAGQIAIAIQNTQALEEANIFRQFAEASGQGLAMATMEAAVTYANPKLLEMLGESNLEAVRNKPFPAYYPAEAQLRLQNEVLPAVASEGQWTGELPVVSTDGRVTPTLQNLFVIRDPEGNPLFRAAVITDITERKQIEAEIEAQVQERTREVAIFKAMAENSLDAIVMADPEARLIYANQAAHELFGCDYETQEMVGKPGAIYWPEEDLPVLAETVMPQALAGGWRGEVRQKRKDGTIFDASALIFPLLDDGGQPTGIVVTIRDITAQKAAEAERERLQQEVIQAQQRAIQELSTPVIPVMERILVMPLVGSIDSMRAKDIMRTLLAGISEQRAKVVILDITGVPIVDSGVANHLNKTIMAARLKGARTIVTGITDAVAETIVDLGIDWTEIETLSDLQTGLIVALGSLGLRLAAR